MLRFKSFIIALFLCCMAGGAWAQSAYEVSVKVDVTDVNAATAREKAMQSAMRQAFETVVKQNVVPSETQALYQMTDDQLINFIQEISVVSEKSSNVRYLAELKVKINEPVFKTYLQEKNIPMMIGAPSKIVVVPVYREFMSDRPLLWENENIWLQAWQNMSVPQGLIDIVPLSSTEAEKLNFNAEKALAYNQEALQEIALNTNAADVYVLDAYFDGIEGLKVNVSSLKSRKAPEELLISGDRKNKDMLMQKALFTVRKKIEDSVKNANMEQNRMQSTLMVIYNYNKLSDWVRVERKLKSVSYVKHLELIALGDNKAQFKMDVIGDENQVWGALRRLGFNFKKYDDFYLLEY